MIVRLDTPRVPTPHPATGGVEGPRLARGPWPALLICAVALFQLDRLVSLTLHHAVNVLYWDQWGFYTPFFEHASLWRIFSWQHGPPRLGVGSVATWMLAGPTHWNTRTDALAIVGIVAVATALALGLKRRLFGPLGLTDVVIPLLLLSRAQYEMLVGATNLAHGPIPLLLTVLLCLAWTLPRRSMRYGLVLAVNFLLIYTAFGLLMGLITPALLALDCRDAFRSRQRRALAAGVAALAIALLSLGSFFIGYAFVPGVEGFRFPYGNAWTYPRYAALMFANVLGLKARDPVGATVVGIVLLAGVVGVLIHHGRLLARGDGRAESRIIVILLAFILMFTAGTAIGRAFLGASGADASRYYLYLMPGMLALYFHVLTLSPSRVRALGLTVAVLGALTAGLHMTRWDEAEMAWVSNGKRAWKDCYLETRSIASCDKATRFKIYPWPQKTRLQWKLDYLERNRLNLFAGTR
jgi:hypothetical protein